MRLGEILDVEVARAGLVLTALQSLALRLVVTNFDRHLTAFWLLSAILFAARGLGTRRSTAFRLLELLSVHLIDSLGRGLSRCELNESVAS